MTTESLIRTGVVLGMGFFARVWAKWRVDKKKRLAFTTPLVDGAILEAALTPRPKDGDDPDLLDEVRDTFAHLNRRAYAEEFWGLHTQLAALDKNLGAPQKATMRRALIRLLIANDRWLQLVAAKTCAELHVTEAINPLRGLLELGDTQRYTADKAEYSTHDAVDLRYREELETALTALQTS